MGEDIPHAEPTLAHDASKLLCLNSLWAMRGNASVARLIVIQADVNACHVIALTGQDDPRPVSVNG